MFQSQQGDPSGPQLNVVGGSALGASNILAGNTDEGVAVFDPGTLKNKISQNSIFSNHIRGIGMGSLYNNSNNNQASPSLGSAILGNSGNVGGTDIAGTLSGSAASTNLPSNSSPIRQQAMKDSSLSDRQQL